MAVGVSNAKSVEGFEADVFYKVATPLIVYGLTDFLPVPGAVHWQRIGLTLIGRRFVTEVRAVLEKQNQQKRLMVALRKAANSTPDPRSTEGADVAATTPPAELRPRSVEESTASTAIEHPTLISGQPEGKAPHKQPRKVGKKSGAPKKG